jgi:hypothetical protein
LDDDVHVTALSTLFSELLESAELTMLHDVPLYCSVSACSDVPEPYPLLH